MIVARVAYRDGAGTQAGLDGAQEGVALPASRLLEALTLIPRLASDVTRAGAQRDPEPAAQVLAECPILR